MALWRVLRPGPPRVPSAAPGLSRPVGRSWGSLECSTGRGSRPTRPCLEAPLSPPLRRTGGRQRARESESAQVVCAHTRSPYAHPHRPLFSRPDLTGSSASGTAGTNESIAHGIALRHGCVPDLLDRQVDLMRDPPHNARTPNTSAPFVRRSPPLSSPSQSKRDGEGIESTYRRYLIEHVEPPLFEARQTPVPHDVSLFRQRSSPSLSEAGRGHRPVEQLLPLLREPPSVHRTQVEVHPEAQVERDQRGWVRTVAVDVFKAMPFRRQSPFPRALSTSTRGGRLAWQPSQTRRVQGR